MPFSKHIEDVIADFRGLPRTVTASARREPVPLDNLLVMFREQYGPDRLGPERVLVENWESIFGSGAAGRCNPIRIKDDRTLVVSVTNQTLRSELQFMKRTILKKIRRLEHCKDIRDLLFRG